MSTVDRVAGMLAVHWNEPGYGKVQVDYGASEVRVFWKGDPPDPVTRLAGTSVDGVNVELIAVDFSAAELDIAGREAARLIERRFGPGKVAATMPSATMAGLVVEIVRPGIGSVEDIEAVLGVPIAVRLVDEAPVPLAD